MRESLPIPLYSTEQIKEQERQAIATGISGFELMTRAGEAAYNVLRERWTDAQSFVVFCGAGNNAGDGYIVAHLLQLSGLMVRVVALSEPQHLTPDALLAYQSYCTSGGTVDCFTSKELLFADVLIDALLGTGLSRPLNDLYAEAVHAINNSKLPCLAIDVPTGISADTGSTWGPAVQASCTITFIGLKKGLFTGDAPHFCGDILHDGLMLNSPIAEGASNALARISHHPLPKRHRCAHKGANGHVLIIGGACGFSGALMLAGHAALRVGSGLVSLATRPEHANIINLNFPELMCHAVTTPEQLLPLLDKATVVAIGPGLGQSTWAKSLLAETLSIEKPLILDADALNLIAVEPAFNKRSDNFIMTPHPGEAARLLNISTQHIQQDRYTAIRALQNRYGGIMVLKGAGTLVADSKCIAVSNTGNPGMASGGMGDVLTGVITGLKAQGLSLIEAAQQGVLIHGMAADSAALQAGERGLIASDLMDFLRRWVN